MKKLLLVILSLTSLSSFAASMSCKMIKGSLPNNMLKPKSITIESISNNVEMINAEKLVINVLGMDEVFTKTAVSFSKGFKADFTHRGNENVKAVMLASKYRVGRDGNMKAFKGLIVITGTGIDIGNESNSIYHAKSLVYNVLCK